MTSTKELYANGLNYILRDIQDCSDMLETATEYKERLLAKNGNSMLRCRTQLDRINTEVTEIKALKRKYEKEFKRMCDYFGYTENDLKKHNIHPATDEEIEQDYINDMKEGTGYDEKAGKGKYTMYDHYILVQNVNNYNKEHGLPLVNF